MKKITVTCALLLLSSCGNQVGTVAGDSSPIIISDGSVKLNQPDHFRVHGAKRASVRLGNHKPTFLGFQCDPYAGACTAGDCAGLNAQPNCQVNLAVLKNWSLALSDGTNAATLTWDKNAPEKIAIALPKGFTVADGAGGGSVDLVPSASPLQSAAFASGGNPINFACPTGKMCLTLDYYCGSGCTPP
jgi:hypothetical protein